MLAAFVWWQRRREAQGRDPLVRLERLRPCPVPALRPAGCWWPRTSSRWASSSWCRRTSRLVQGDDALRDRPADVARLGHPVRGGHVRSAAWPRRFGPPPGRPGRPGRLLVLGAVGLVAVLLPRHRRPRSFLVAMGVIGVGIGLLARPQLGNARRSPRWTPRPQPGWAASSTPPSSWAGAGTARSAWWSSGRWPPAWAADVSSDRRLSGVGGKDQVGVALEPGRRQLRAGDQVEAVSHDAARHPTRSRPPSSSTTPTARSRPCGRAPAGRPDCPGRPGLHRGPSGPPPTARPVEPVPVAAEPPIRSGSPGSRAGGPPPRWPHVVDEHRGLGGQPVAVEQHLVQPGIGLDQPLLGRHHLTVEPGEERPVLTQAFDGLSRRVGEQVERDPAPELGQDLDRSGDGSAHHLVVPLAPRRQLVGVVGVVGRHLGHRLVQGPGPESWLATFQAIRSSSVRKRSISSSSAKIERYRWRGFQSSSTPPMSNTTARTGGSGGRPGDGGRSPTECARCPGRTGRRSSGRARLASVPSRHVQGHRHRLVRPQAAGRLGVDAHRLAGLGLHRAVDGPGGGGHGGVGGRGAAAGHVPVRAVTLAVFLLVTVLTGDPPGGPGLGRRTGGARTGSVAGHERTGGSTVNRQDRGQAFEVVCEVEPPTRPDLVHVRHQIGVLSKVASAFLIPDNHLGRATVSSVAVAHEVAAMGGRSIACLNGRDRNRLGLRRDLLTAAAYGVDQFLLVARRSPARRQPPGLGVRTMVEEIRTFGRPTRFAGHPPFRVGATTRLGPLAGFKRGRTSCSCRCRFDVDALVSWREALDFSGPVYAGVLVLASPAMAARIAGQIGELEIPASVIDQLERDPGGGVELACAQVEAIEASGAFEGVHLVTVSRYREVAARLEASARGR